MVRGKWGNEELIFRMIRIGVEWGGEKRTSQNTMDIT
jgi:hypothetical protein